MGHLQWQSSEWQRGCHKEVRTEARTRQFKLQRCVRGTKVEAYVRGAQLGLAGPEAREIFRGQVSPAAVACSSGDARRARPSASQSILGSSTWLIWFRGLVQVTCLATRFVRIEPEKNVSALVRRPIAPKVSLLERASLEWIQLVAHCI